MPLLDQILQALPYWVPGVVALAVTTFAFAFALGTGIHIVLKKKDTRAATAWLGLVGLVPLLGSILYLLLGINRIRRKATTLRHGSTEPERKEPDPAGAEEVESAPVPDLDHLGPLARLGDAVLGLPLLPGNRVEPLYNGEEAFPAMLEAIEGAERSVALLTYLFDRDPTGEQFVEALEAAHRRGVTVRLLIDAVGLRYSTPTVAGLLRKTGIRWDLFLPPRWPWKLPHLNLRNHRKILVVDGATGFTGGMNIRHDHRLDEERDFPTRDVHFRVRGPVVAQLMEAFATDWAFTTEERLAGETWFPDLESCGEMLARGIPDGPDEDFEKVQWAVLGAIAAARERILVQTPYFLPESPLETVLTLAALRGVRIDILLPAVTNHTLVQWACNAHLPPLIQKGCHVWLSPPPFDHSKLMVVDGTWTLLGSTNMDPRSFRLNFEYCMEVYDESLAGRLTSHLDDLLEEAHPVREEELTDRWLPWRLRDGVARLLTPYL